MQSMTTVPLSSNNGNDLPDFVRRFNGPHPLRRLFARAVIGAIDSGWTGRTPLRTHLVVCGFPRGGTTLMSLMLQVAYTGAKAFRKERAAIRAAYLTDRNHALMISKRPDDIFYLEPLRAIYARRRPNVRFLLMMRDPRAVLTSVHSSKKGQYYVSPKRWSGIYERIRENAGKEDCLLVRYEDLVTSIDDVQRVVTRFIGEEPEVPFNEYLDHVPPGFRSTALNGLRALDANAMNKWRDPKHAPRIRSLLIALPDLPRILVELGYERDTSWAQAYGPGGSHE
jgi:hypothetical protein